MQTVYDWLSVGVFAALIVLFLQRSSGDEPPRDSLWQYLLAIGGCALFNWLGNHDYVLGALIAGAAVLIFIAVVLKPFDFRTK